MEKDSQNKNSVAKNYVGTGKSVADFAFPAFLSLAVLTGLWMLAVGWPEPARRWYSISNHLPTPFNGRDITSVFAATLLVLSLLFVLPAMLASLLRFRGSATAGDAYKIVTEIMAFCAAGLIVVLGLWISPVSPLPDFVILSLVAVVGFLAAGKHFLAAEKRQDILSGLTSFFLLFTRRELSDENERKIALQEVILGDSQTPLNRIITLILPALLLVSGLLSATVLVQFGWAVIIIATNAVALLLPMDAQVLKPAVAKASLVSTKTFLSYGFFLIFAVLFFLSGYLRRRYVRTYASVVIRFGARLLYRMWQAAFLVMAVYALGAAISTESDFAYGPALPLAVGMSVVYGVTFFVNHSEAIFEKLAIKIHGNRTRIFWVNTQHIFDTFPQPRKSKGYVFFHSQSDTYTVASFLLILCRLRQLGWASIIVDRWPIKSQPTGEKFVDRFCHYSLGDQRTLNYDWKIDWNNGVVEAVGMNFYHPIWEGLSRHFGRYTLDLERNSQAEKIFREILQVADATLLLDFRIFNTVAGHGKPVRMVGGSGQFVPNAVHNIFCRTLGRNRDMHFVWLQQGYQTYYADNAKLSTRISIQDMTAKWPYSNPYLPHVDDFNAWVDKGQDTDALMAEAQAWANTNRATQRTEMIPAARAVMDRIEAHRKKGGAVICVLGKMVFDLSTPYERGPAHTGMFDWLNNTVETIRGHKDVLMVIKPHPYEARPEIAGRVEQYFTDMIECELPDNAIILGHDWFNLHTLMPVIDLGVMWNGTSGLEFGLQNIPMVMCSEWGPIDYSVGFPAPEDRADYERILRNPKSIKVPREFAEKCALMLKYTASDEVMIPYDYAARPLTNKPFGPPYWFMDRVRKFIKNGDKHIDVAAQRVISTATKEKVDEPTAPK